MTLAANDRMRLVRDRLSRREASKLFGYQVPTAGFRFRACSYASRHTTTLALDANDGGNAEPPAFTWAINGDYAALSVSESGTDEGTSRSAGISTETLTIWNSRTRRSVTPCCRLTGLRFSELIVSPTGSVAAIGNPYRFGGGSDEDPPGPVTKSSVLVFEPKAPPPDGSAEQVWRTVDDGTTGSLSGLALSGTTLVWSGPAGLGQAALR